MKTASKYLQLLALLVTSASLALPGSAIAGSTSPTAGVHVDPGSPAAKEYALPLATARGAPADTGASGSLFGAGVSKQRSGGSTDASTTTATVRTTTPAVTSAPTSEPSTTPAPVESTDPRRATTRHRPKHTAVHRHPRRRPKTPKPAVSKPVHSIAGGGSPKTKPPAALQILHPGTGASWLWMLLAALAVLAPGCGGALLVLRARRRHADPYPN